MLSEAASRREFLLSAGVFSAAAMLGPPRVAQADEPDESADPPHQGVPEFRPAPAQETITRETFIDAEKLANVSYSDPQREMMADSITAQIERFRRRLEHPFHPNDLAPALTFDPRLPGSNFDHIRSRFAVSRIDPGPLPDDEADIAFAPVAHLSRWMQRGDMTSTRLTRIYLDRLKHYDGTLKCAITLTEELALEQAARADAEIAAGRYRGPLHGIPWGAKDLLDTAGIRTTWGAEPFVDRVPNDDAHVVKSLNEAGAVLVAKLSLGALAYNDIWFGGRTNNPWNPEQGSSGSSAGSAAATAAGLVGFSIGTETYGSIVSPCMRCGTTGLRPTFGRVGRSGAMALCWSLDKIGPICRSVEDCILVLNAINGRDADDPSSIDMPISYDAAASLRTMRVGYNPAWFDGQRAHAFDRDALDAMKPLGVEMVEIDLPDLSYDSLINILLCEAASAFEELTRTGQDASLAWQSPVAWPNTFRQTWFIPGPELVQADRLRRGCMEVMAEVFERVDLILAPSFAASLLLITNNTGHPSLTLRCGIKDDGTPHGITLIGRLFDEGALCRAGAALERALDVWHRRPPI